MKTQELAKFLSIFSNQRWLLEEWNNFDFLNEEILVLNAETLNQHSGAW